MPNESIDRFVVTVFGAVALPPVKPGAVDPSRQFKKRAFPWVCRHLSLSVDNFVSKEKKDEFFLFSFCCCLLVSHQDPMPPVSSFCRELLLLLAFQITFFVLNKVSLCVSHHRILCSSATFLFWWISACLAPVNVNCLCKRIDDNVTAWTGQPLMTTVLYLCFDVPATLPSS